MTNKLLIYKSKEDKGVRPVINSGNYYYHLFQLPEGKVNNDLKIKGKEGKEIYTCELESIYNTEMYDLIEIIEDVDKQLEIEKDNKKVENNVIKIKGVSSGLEIHNSEFKDVHQEEVFVPHGKRLLLNNIKRHLSSNWIALKVEIREYDSENKKWINKGKPYRTDRISTFDYTNEGKDRNVLIAVSLKHNSYKDVETAGDSWDLDFVIE